MRILLTRVVRPDQATAFIEPNLAEMTELRLRARQRDPQIREYPESYAEGYASERDDDRVGFERRFEFVREVVCAVSEFIACGPVVWRGAMRGCRNPGPGKSQSIVEAG